LTERFRPVFTQVAAGALERERTRALAHDAVALLRDASFGALRVPRDHGGLGASASQLYALLIELAAADSKTHAKPPRDRPRGHRGFASKHPRKYSWENRGGACSNQPSAFPVHPLRRASIHPICHDRSLRYTRSKTAHRAHRHRARTHPSRSRPRTTHS
jgi:hypothetical protein